MTKVNKRLVLYTTVIIFDARYITDTQIAFEKVKLKTYTGHILSYANSIFLMIILTVSRKNNILIFDVYIFEINTRKVSGKK